MNASGKQLWFIPTAHRNGTTSLSAHNASSIQYFVSGGEDGAVRVWKFSNRELVSQYTEHRRSVAKVLIDEKKPHVVHSVGSDCSVLSFDLKASKRIICHIINSGSMTNMTQRKDNENELITCDTMGRLLYWDVDYRDPVLIVQDPSRNVIRCCEISPSGAFLAFAGDDQMLKVLEVNSQRIVSLGLCHSDAIVALTWTPDEKQILTCSEDRCLGIWNFYLGGVEK
jgi:WD repeat-containing protein 61